MKKFLLPLLVGLLVGGCVQEHDYEGEEGGAKLSVSDAQNYFEDNATEFEPINLLYTGDNEVSTRSVLPQIVLTPNWEEATAYENDGAAVVDVPILSNAEQSIRLSDCKDGVATQIYRRPSENRLVIMKSNGEDLMFVLTLIPDEHSLVREASEVRFMHPGSDFDGLAMLSQLDGSLVCVLSYVKGRPSDIMYAVPYQSLTEEDVKNLGDHTLLHPTTYLQSGSSTRGMEWDGSAYGTARIVTAVVVGSYGGGGYLTGGGLVGGGLGSSFLSALRRAWAELNRLLREAQEKAAKEAADQQIRNAAPNASKILKSSSLSLSQWTQLEKMIIQIKSDCMGDHLFGGLVAKMGGTQFTLSYSPTSANAQFTGTSVIINSFNDIPAFMHELFHGYQFKEEGSIAKWNGATANLEMEAQIAKHKFMNPNDPHAYAKEKAKLLATDRRFNTNMMNMAKVLNNKGVLSNPAYEPSFNQSLYDWGKAIADDTTNDKGHNYEWDYTRSTFDSNMKNIKELSKNC